ncbi:MAG: hypothetical protein ACYC7F_02050 [Gemmatimonadaceae bacterium]
MRFLPLLRLIVVTALAGATIAPRAAVAQWIRVGQGGGEVGVEVRDDRSVDGGRPGASGTQLGQWLNVPLSGVIVSPRLLSYSLNIRPTWRQQTMFGQPARVDTRSVGMGATANLLPNALISLSAYADRMTSGTEGGLGSLTRYAANTGGGTLRLRNAAFPVVAEWNVRATNDVWQATPEQLPVYRNETLHTTRLTGQSSKLRATIERLRFEDLVGALDFTSLGGLATHFVTWGKGSSAQSMLELFARDGHDAQRRRSLSERLLLQQSKTVSTALAADSRRTVGSSDETSTFTGSATVRVQPREWVSTGLMVSSTSSAFGRGHIRMLSADPHVHVEMTLPHGARLRGSFSTGYSRVSQRLPSDSWIVVVDERHAIEKSRTFVLAQERGDRTTLTVQNREHTITYLPDIDYRVSVVGPLVQIDVPLASRMAVGDEVEVTYSYQALAAGDYDVRRGDAAVAFSIGGFSLTPSASLRRGYSRAAEPGMALSNSPSRMNSGDDFVLTAGFHHPTAIGRFDLDVSRRSRERSPSDFVMRELRGGYQPRLLSTLQAAVGASVARTATINDDVRVVTSSAAVTWTPFPTTRVMATRETWLWQPRSTGAEETVIWNAELGFTSGRMEAEFRYVVQRRYAAVEQTQRRLFCQLRRRF